MDTGTVVVALLAMLLLVYITIGLKVIEEHEQGVVMRFGRFHHVVLAGLVLVVPFVDVLRRVDLCTLVVEQRINPAAGAGKVRLWVSCGRRVAFPVRLSDLARRSGSPNSTAGTSSWIKSPGGSERDRQSVVVLRSTVA